MDQTKRRPKKPSPKTAQAPAAPKANASPGGVSLVGLSVEDLLFLSKKVAEEIDRREKGHK
jgi:hypothetical protein